MKVLTIAGLVLFTSLLAQTAVSQVPGLSSERFPLGTYATDIARRDIPSSVPAWIASNIVGHWEVTYAADGHQTAIKDATVAAEGHYAATQNQMALHNDKGPLACDIQERDPRVPPGTPAAAYSGTYNWAFDGKAMIFTKVADECAGRVVVTTAHPWTRRK